MITSKATYLGELRTSSVHQLSGTEVVTDAPRDNHGKGEAFSPTDLVANSLATCMLSIMGIKARDLNVDLTGTTADVTKYMQAEPRKISKITVVMNIPVAPDDKMRIILERSAMTCPVFLSLHPDIEKDITFNWGTH
jgi:uncharacterized OsmC-like protein